MTVRYALFGGAVLLLSAILLPAHGIVDSNGLMAMAGDLVVPQAYADSDKSSGKSSSKSSASGSSSGSGSSSSTDCLVCVDVTSISSSAFSSGSSSGSDKEKSDSGSHKVSMCHAAGSSGHNVTLSIDASAVPAHLKQGDSYGACSNTIPTCAALTSSGTTIGIWVPSSAVGSDSALNTYFSDIQSGTSSGLQACSTANATQTYRDIRGQ